MSAGLQFNFGKCDLKAALAGIETIGTAKDAAQLKTLRRSCQAPRPLGAVLAADFVGGDEGA
jgi:hypothetical protein